MNFILLLMFLKVDSISLFCFSIMRLDSFLLFLDLFQSQKFAVQIELFAKIFSYNTYTRVFSRLDFIKQLY
jgi:hypothetical protein